MRNFAKIPLLIVAFALLTFAAADAKAEIDYQDDGGYNPCFDLTYTGPDCYATGSGPQATQCEAYAKKGQKCRTCVPYYTREGQYQGYKVCAYVGYSAECRCENPNTATCDGRGVCDYWVS